MPIMFEQVQHMPQVMIPFFFFSRSISLEYICTVIRSKDYMNIISYIVW